MSSEKFLCFSHFRILIENYRPFGEILSTGRQKLASKVQTNFVRENNFSKSCSFWVFSDNRRRHFSRFAAIFQKGSQDRILRLQRKILRNNLFLGKPSDLLSLETKQKILNFWTIFAYLNFYCPVEILSVERNGFFWKKNLFLPLFWTLSQVFLAF